MLRARPVVSLAGAARRWLDVVSGGGGSRGAASAFSAGDAPAATRDTPLMPGPRTDQPLRHALPMLLKQKRTSMRALAVQIDVDIAHLSRAVRHADGKRPSGDLAAKIAKALDLPEDYFPEAREAAVVESVRADPDLRDRLYDTLQKYRRRS